MVVNFPSADWLSDLRTQLKTFVAGVCLQSKRFFLVLFSRINFFAWSRHFKELQLKGNLFVCPQIWTVARLTYKKQKYVCELFISKYFFSESDFCTITSHFLNPISKMFCNFLLQLNMEKRRHSFLALFVLKLRKKWIGEKQNSLWLVASKRWLGLLHLVAVKKSAIHFISKFLVWFDSQLYKLWFDIGV